MKRKPQPLFPCTLDMKRVRVLKRRTYWFKACEPWERMLCEVFAEPVKVASARSLSYLLERMSKVLAKYRHESVPSARASVVFWTADVFFGHGFLGSVDSRRGLTKFAREAYERNAQ